MFRVFTPPVYTIHSLLLHMHWGFVLYTFLYFVYIKSFLLLVQNSKYLKAIVRKFACKIRSLSKDNEDEVSGHVRYP